jgi:hypothetical protein
MWQLQGREQLPRPEAGFYRLRLLLRQGKGFSQSVGVGLYAQGLVLPIFTPKGDRSYKGEPGGAKGHKCMRFFPWVSGHFSWTLGVD